MLLHYPECWGTLCEGTPPQGTWKDSWRAFEHAVDQGKLRAIGERVHVRQLQRHVVEVAQYQRAICHLNFLRNGASKTCQGLYCCVQV
jgi:diketogulonate reductase-like aldo/keto reductase